MVRIGLTGWLDPAGIFHPCNYGEHSAFAQEIIGSYSAYDKLRDEMYYIPMGAAYDEDKAYLFLNIDDDKLEPIITDAQRKWLDDNLHRLAKGQQQMVDDWLNI